MQKCSLDDLPRRLSSQLPTEASGELLVGFSGGLDSTVLLHLLVGSALPIRAVHINHNLQPNAPEWECRCAQVADALGVSFLARAIDVPRDFPGGLEASARLARYAALRELLRPGETLLTAHHADDQLETLLLALVRGSGVEGLASMPRMQRFGEGWHARPLLDFTREQLESWARARGITWSEDPSNATDRFDRNYLRARVVPALRSRWPSVAHTAVRAASHVGEACELLDHVAHQDLNDATVGSCLRVSALRSFDTARRRNVLRHWLRSCGARAPTTRKLIALEHDMLSAQAARLPCVSWDDVEVRRHRDLLYCMSSSSFSGAPIEWQWRDELQCSGMPGVLRAEIAHGRGIKRSALSPRITVRRRSGGERLLPQGQRHHRTLKNLLQETNVLPWWRDRLPLIYANDRLVAVADMWIESSVAADSDEEGVSFVWQGRPQVHAMEPS